MKRMNFIGRVRSRREKALELRKEDIGYYKENIEAVQNDLKGESLNKDLKKEHLQELERKLSIAENEKAVLEKRI